LEVDPLDELRHLPAQRVDLLFQLHHTTAVHLAHQGIVPPVPFQQEATLLVGELPRADEDGVVEPPQPEPAQRAELQDAGDGLADVEAVGAVNPSTTSASATPRNRDEARGAGSMYSSSSGTSASGSVTRPR
jgi:hypothetical protein